MDQIIRNHIFKIKHHLNIRKNTSMIFATSVHSYSTRFSENSCFSVPKVKGFGKKSFAYHECTLWNDLPVDLKNIVGLKDFKAAVKSYF